MVVYSKVVNIAKGDNYWYKVSERVLEIVSRGTIITLEINLQ